MQTLAFTLRQLRRSPGFTLTSMLTLALGVGATATMFSVVQSVMLAPPSYPEPDRMVGIAFAFPHDKPNAEQVGVAADFVAEHSRSFSSTGIAEDASGGVNFSYGHGDATHSIQIAEQRVSRDYLPTLGIAHALGRGFLAEEDRHDRPKTMLLSDSLGERAFHRDAPILNHTIRLNEDAYTVIGIMPPLLRGRILAGVVRGGMTLAVAGLLLGAAGSVLVRRAVAAMLEDAISTGDDPITKVLIGNGPTIAASACAILLAAAAASYLAARRGAAVQPTVALRAE